MLSFSLAFGQGAEIEDETAEESTDRLLFIPRVEFNPYLVGPNCRYTGPRYDFGGSSLYTLFEGGIGNSDFSYSVQGHWVSGSIDATKGLYTNLFYSQESSFIDWAYITYSPGNFDISAGKQMIAIGSFEEDAYDFDQYSGLSSTMWNNLQTYVYAVGLGYNFENGSNLTAQFSTSPFGERPFLRDSEGGAARWAASLKFTGEFGCWSPIWSVNYLQAWDRPANIGVVSLGNSFSFCDFTLVVDYTPRWCWGDGDFGSEGTVAASLSYNLNDKFNFSLRGGYEYNKSGVDVFGWYELGANPFESYVPTSLALAKNYYFGGALVEWFPLRNSQDLKVHAFAATNSWSKGVAFNLGVTYYFDLLKYIR